MNRLHAAFPIVVKKYVWNMKYALLGYPRFVAPADALQYLSATLSGTEALLDLGCGRGSLIRGLRKTGWMGYYCGVDISNHAIRDARTFKDQRCSWVVSDLEAFRSPFKWDAVVMIESMNYVKLAELPAVLNRLMGMLADRGVFVVRLHDPNKHSEYVRTIHELYPGTQNMGTNLFRIAAGSPRSVGHQA